LLIIFEIFHREKESALEELENISYPKALVIGLFQSIAIVPGVSRAAATIIGGLLLNLKRQTIVEFSFLLAVPTMLAASTLDLAKNYQTFSFDQFGILAVGFIISFIVAWLSIKWLLGFIKNHSFIGFGVYRILAAIFFWFFIVR
jgi:undecaprenyl-diphosphatase